jgi:peroxiredoxin
VFGALTVLGFVALGVERFRRGELRVARDWAPVPVVMGAMAGITALAAHGTLANTGEAVANRSELWQAVVRQDLRVGERLPGFWMTDQHGRLIRTAEYRGKILLFYLFSSQDTDSATNLTGLNNLVHELGARGVQPIAVCLSEDRSDPTILARSSNFDFPLLADPTTVRLSPPHSVMAVASRAENLPLLAITDRRLTVRTTFTGTSADPVTLRRAVEERLTEEPE